MSKSKLVEEIDSSIKWLEQLRKDLESGKAKEVPARFGHVHEHLLDPVPAQSRIVKDGETTKEIAMVTRTTHVDILKLWAVCLYIAECPEMGIRFVEGPEVK